jgi:hypothetical protein
MAITSMRRKATRTAMGVAAAGVAVLFAAQPASAYSCTALVGGTLGAGNQITLTVSNLNPGSPGETATVASACLVGGSVSGAANVAGQAVITGTVVASYKLGDTCTFSVNGVSGSQCQDSSRTTFIPPPPPADVKSETVTQTPVEPPKVLAETVASSDTLPFTGVEVGGLVLLGGGLLVGGLVLSGAARRKAKETPVS